VRAVRLVGQLRNELTGESSRVELVGELQELDLAPEERVRRELEPWPDFRGSFDPLSDPLDDPFPEERR
jgi:hypothetical protein